MIITNLFDRDSIWNWDEINGIDCTDGTVVSNVDDEIGNEIEVVMRSRWDLVVCDKIGVTYTRQLQKHNW